jgi:hypothetical protein
MLAEEFKEKQAAAGCFQACQNLPTTGVNSPCLNLSTDAIFLIEFHVNFLNLCLDLETLM